MRLDDVEPAVQAQVEVIYGGLDVLAVFLMAMVGATIARQKRYDVTGFFVLAVISGLGGGMIRDTLIQKGAPIAVDQRIYLILAVSGALVAWAIRFRGRPWELFQAHADAVITAAFAATGAAKALSYGFPPLSGVLMGMITAAGGTMIRDVITGEQPKILRGGQMVLIPAIVSAVICELFYYRGLEGMGLLLGLLGGSVLAIATYWFDWNLLPRAEFAPVSDGARVARRKLRQARREESASAVPVSTAISAQSETLPEPQELIDEATLLGPDDGSEPRYHFDDVLRALHADESEEGKQKERDFISAWLDWEVDRKPPSTEPGQHL